MDHAHLILGSPGCGKTTRLLREVDAALHSGIKPSEIAFVSFTKKAANEAAQRACETFALQRADLPYFRTLHSCAYRALGLAKTDVLNDYRDISEALGLSFTASPDQVTFLPSGTGHLQEIPFLEALARNRCISLEEQWHDWQEINPESFIDWNILALYQRTLHEYKQDMGLHDYTDILQGFVKQRLILPVKLLIVDEAQDLSRLQWQLIRIAARDVERILIAGDDDQCIYQWAGADIETFLKLKGTREVLQQSHRLPKAVYDKAQDIVSRIRQRYTKKWNPRNEAGEYLECGSVESVPINADETYMFLARNHFYTNEIKAFLREAGYFYATVGHETSVRPEYLSAIRGWEALRKGTALLAAHVGAIYDLIKVGQGIERGSRLRLLRAPQNEPLTIKNLIDDFGLTATGIWHDALTLMPVEDREYIISCLRNGEHLNRPPRIYVGTIHSVKGGEADNVVIVPDLSRLTWKGYNLNEDAENRVLYVGVTRARRRLITLLPRTPRYYFI